MPPQCALFCYSSLKGLRRKSLPTLSSPRLPMFCSVSFGFRFYNVSVYDLLFQKTLVAVVRQRSRVFQPSPRGPVNPASQEVEKTNLSPWNDSGVLLKNQLAIYVWVYFWTLNSVPFIYWSISPVLLKRRNVRDFLSCLMVGTRAAAGADIFPATFQTGIVRDREKWQKCVFRYSLKMITYF